MNSLTCHRHPDRPATSLIYAGGPALCSECTRALQLGGRAYGTGLGADAHREAQEAKRYDREIQEGKENAKVRKYL